MTTPSLEAATDRFLAGLSDLFDRLHAEAILRGATPAEAERAVKDLLIDYMRTETERAAEHVDHGCKLARSCTLPAGHIGRHLQLVQ